MIFINNNQCWTAIKSKKHSYSEYAHKKALYFNKKKNNFRTEKKTKRRREIKSYDMNIMRMFIIELGNKI